MPPRSASCGRSRSPRGRLQQPGSSTAPAAPAGGSPSPLRRLPQGKRGESFLHRVSRGLQVLLRHRAPAHGIHTDPGGWASLDEVLDLPLFQEAGVSRSHVDALGEDPALGAGRRFQFKQDVQGRTLIRAIQGHTLPHIDP